MDNTFKGAAKRITDLDIPRIGAMVGVGEDEIHAFMDIEAAGSGFDAKGRPKLLFEPHVFYRNLSGAKRTAAVKAGLAYAKWGAKPYPRDSYPRLVAAMAIDETAALKSASWGLTQILGENFKAAGYGTVQAMVQAFMADEAAHLEATVKLLVAWKVDDDLRAHRWPVVAQTWNGPGYKKNRYDSKLAKAFAKWQKIRDTPWPPKAGAPGVVADDLAAGASVATSAKVYTDKTTVEVVQRRLKDDLGYTEIGNVDGEIGTNTETALLAFRKDNGLPLVPVIDDAVLTTLDTAKKRVMSPARSDAAPAEVRAVVPEAATSWRNKLTGIGGLGGGGLLFGNGILQNLGTAKDTIAPVTGLFTWIPMWGWGLIAIGVAGFIYYNSQRGEAAATEAYKTGARR